MNDTKIIFNESEFQLKPFTLEMNNFSSELQYKKEALIETYKEKFKFVETPILRYAQREKEISVSLVQLKQIDKLSKEKEKQFGHLTSELEKLNRVKELDMEYQRAVAKLNLIEENAVKSLAKDKELMAELYNFVEGDISLLDFTQTGDKLMQLIIFNVALINTLFFSIILMELKALNSFNDTNNRLTKQGLGVNTKPKKSTSTKK
jgi:predicted RNase H-like nuclease (RuvC/YqgF family)